MPIVESYKVGTPFPLQYVPTWQGPHALELEDPEQSF